MNGRYNVNVLVISLRRSLFSGLKARHYALVIDEVKVLTFDSTLSAPIVEINSELWRGNVCNV